MGSKSCCLATGAQARPNIGSDAFQASISEECEGRAGQSRDSPFVCEISASPSVSQRLGETSVSPSVSHRLGQACENSASPSSQRLEQASDLPSGGAPSGGGATASPKARCRLERSYPMYGLSIQDFLEMERWEPHQDLLKSGKVQPVGRKAWVVFVSHEWSSWKHPDPDNIQLRTLQRLLKRLMDGQISEVESFWNEQLSLGSSHKVSIKSADWQDMLPQAFLWIDYVSVPQPGALRDTERGRRLSDSRLDHNAEKVNPVEEKLRTQLQLAVNSIPSYVDKSSMVVVLAPTCIHKDTQAVCNFSSWRTRGWCRMEVQAALLSIRRICVLVCIGPEAVPFVLPSYDLWRLNAGRGFFTCCQRGHNFNGRPIPCDKLAIHNVLSELLNMRLQHLAMTGQSNKYRIFRCMRRWFLRGLLQSDGALKDLESGFITKGDTSELDPISMLKNQLRWRADDDEIAQCTGRTLLRYGVLCDAPELVSQLMESKHVSELEHVLDKPDFTCGERREKALAAAAAFASPDVVRCLLDARANPVNPEYDIVIRAGQMNRNDIIQAWLDYFPIWDLERPNKSYGTTAIQQFVYYAEDGRDSMDTLMRLLCARCDTVRVNHFGMSLLHSACFNLNRVPELLKQLLKTTADVNRRMWPQNENWKEKLSKAREAITMGLHDEVSRELSCWEGSTALMIAARRGKIEEVRALLGARADAQIREKMGRTALQMVEEIFGGSAYVPPELQKLLAVQQKPRPKMAI